MAIAVIATGGKQHLVKEGELLTIERLTAEPNTTVEFTDLLHGKTVKATVVAHGRGDKVHVVKYKSKVRYLRRQGHRQLDTQVRIDAIA